MAFPDTPLPILVEAFLNDTWTDVTATPVYQRADIVINGGRRDETGRPGPASASLQINNRPGDFTPSNPLGAYYGSIGRNTPLRISLVIAEDTFTRTVPNSWGTSDTGIIYTQDGAGGTVAAGDFNTTGTTGTHSVPVADAYRRTSSSAATINCAILEQRIDLTLPFSNITGGSVSTSFYFRVTGSSTGYIARMVITTSETVQLELDSPTGAIASTTVAGLTFTGQTLTFAAQLEGSTLRAKAFATASGEPFAWQLTATDTTTAAPGYTRVESKVHAGNTNTKPIVYTYDNYHIRIPVYAGEITRLPVMRDVSGRDTYVPIDSAGILRRITQGASPLASSLYRGITSLTTNVPLAYWPCEDVDGSTSIAPAIGGIPMTIVGDPDFAANTSIPASNALPNVNGSAWTGRIPTYTATGGIMVRFVCSFGTSPPATEQPIMVIGTTGTATFWHLVYTTGGSGGVKLVAGTPYLVALDTGDLGISLTPAHAFSMELVQNGANVDWTIREQPNLHLGNEATAAVSGTLNAYTIGAASLVIVNAYQGITSLSAGHVTVYPQVASYTVNDARMANAHTNEAAGRRAERLSGEEQLAFTATGDLDDTARMGPQRVASLPQLLNECADADLGTLVEARGDLAVHYRTRTSLYNQQAKLDVDFSTGQLAPDFQAVFDDQQTRNDNTVSRVGGSSARSVKATGVLSIEQPPAGAGRYDNSTTLNVFSDTQLPDIAGWLTWLGTQPEPRYPDIVINLARNPELLQPALDLIADDRFTISNAAAAKFWDQISLLARGFTLTLNASTCRLRINSAPEAPYRVGEVDSASYGRCDTAGSELASSLTSSAMTASVAVTSGPLWTTTGAHFPFDIDIAGEVMTLSGISGASSPQTLTISARAVNGVVTAHTAGEPVGLAQPVPAAL